MNSKIFQLVALIALMTGWFSCSNDMDEYGYQWDGSLQKEEFLPINAGKKTSSFAIDSNIKSFAVPYLVGTTATEHLPTPYCGSTDRFIPHFWTIFLALAKGSDVTKLAPTITLAPGVTILRIEHIIESQYVSKYVDYTGIAEVGAIDFSKQVDITIKAPDGSHVIYKFLAIAIGDVIPCDNCPNEL